MTWPRLLTLASSLALRQRDLHRQFSDDESEHQTQPDDDEQ
jgi:hypothetical protein